LGKITYEKGCFSLFIGYNGGENGGFHQELGGVIMPREKLPEIVVDWNGFQEVTSIQKQDNAFRFRVQAEGKVYTFAETNVCLRTGERSKMMCGNAGVTFTEEEYEAMSILDKNAEEYENCAKFRSHLSTIVRMANDLANTIARERYKNSIK
jgi:hypothetical protein